MPHELHQHDDQHGSQHGSRDDDRHPQPGPAPAHRTPDAGHRADRSTADHSGNPGHDMRDGHGSGHGPGHAHAHGLDAVPDDGELAVMLDLDAEVLHAHLAEVAARVAAYAAGLPVRRILDLGCGTGAGTFALLPHFPGADATAVDKSAQLLEHLAGKTRKLGYAGRVATVEADLDAAEWPEFGSVDLVWASASLHHMADPGRALRAMSAVLRPSGVLAVTELDGFPYFLPEDLGVGRPGLEARCRAALSRQHGEDLPHLGADWARSLAKAGFTVEDEVRYAVELRGPLPVSAGRYAQAMLRRMASGIGDLLDVGDRAVLDLLTADTGPHSVLHRPDLSVRTERTLWLARRPAS